MNSIDNVMKMKLNNYNLAKGTLVQIQRKKTYVFYPRPYFTYLFDSSFQRKSGSQVLSRNRSSRNLHPTIRIPGDTASCRTKVCLPSVLVNLFILIILNEGTP